MRLRQGSIGAAECVALTFSSLCVNGIFSVDRALAYNEGNSTYIFIPAAILISLVPVILAARAMKKSGACSLGELFVSSFGKAAPLIMLPLAFSLIFCAAEPMIGFVRVLHVLVYDGADYMAILFFVIPVTVYMALKGLECMGRAALISAGIFLIFLAAAVISAAPSFEAYRLFPVMGEGALGTAGLSLSSTLYALGPYSALLINCRGVRGPENASSYACRAALVSAPVCAAAHLALALVFPAGMLSKLELPLFRLGFLSLFQSYALRLDKLLIMAWLGTCMLQSAYCVYSAGILFADVFDQKDHRPPVLVFCLVFCSALMTGLGLGGIDTQSLRSAVSRFGALAAAVPVLACAAAGFAKQKRRIAS